MIFEIARAIYNERKKEKHYCKMTVSALQKLSSDEFLEALSARILQEEGSRSVEESLRYFHGAKKIFYVVDYFDMEIQNGGLHQYFVNASKATVPYILESLEEIHAYAYRELFKKFMQDYKQSKDILPITMRNADEYEQKNRKVLFEEFDEAYGELYETEPLNMLLENYCRKYIEEFG